MSRSAIPASSTPSSRFKLTVKLEGAGNVSRWKTALQGKLFRLIRNTNMDKLSTASTLDTKYFKTNFAEDWKRASRDEDNAVVEPFDDADFVQTCLEHAIDSGEGFKDWLYDVFDAIRESLCDEIADQTAGVALGDLEALFKGINLAIGHIEHHDPDDLDIIYSQCTMEGEGHNDVMKFTAVLASYMRRLSSAGHAVEDSKAQRVLLRGLNQDIFEVFINTAERTPYESYAELEKALKTAAAKPRMLTKLKELKPGTSQSAMVTRAHYQRKSKEPDEQRLDRIESLLTTMTSNGKRVRDDSNGRDTKQRQACFDFAKGRCSRGDRCNYEHVTNNNNNGRDNSGNKRRRTGGGESSDNEGQGGKRFEGDMYCTLHHKHTHNTADCAVVNSLAARGYKLAPGDTAESVNAARSRTDYACVTRVSLPTHIFAMLGKPKIDLWCVDGAATVMATWDRTKCINIRACNVSIDGPNSQDSFVCKEMGDAYIYAINEDGSEVRILATGVLIDAAFPFHIFSEIKVFKTHATAIKKLGSWQFNKANGEPLFHASQRLLNMGKSGDVELYFIDESPPKQGEHFIAAARTTGENAPTAAVERVSEREKSALKCSKSAQKVLKSAQKVLKNSRVSAPLTAAQPKAPLQNQGGDVDAAQFSKNSKVRTSQTPKPKVATAKNLEILLELHCAHDHRNFADIARQYGLALPSPAPACWACFMAKPARITHDSVSTRVVTRPFEGFAADAKGPISTPTPEGYRYFFVIIGLYSSVLWAFLTKTQADWKTIWPIFVKKAEAKSGKERCVALVVTDAHAVFTAVAYRDFNDDRGIQTVNCSPHSQWQDPAERQIQTLMNAARTSLIHGGGKPWMWGWAILHAVDSINRLEPSHPVPGHENKPRICIVDPSMTPEKALRTLHPFLCLAFKTVPMADRGADFNPRANPCLHLRYDPNKKSYAMLTIPGLHLTHSVEARHVPMCYPLRTTDHLANQLDTFLRPTVEDNLYSQVHGPANMLRRHRLAAPAVDSTTLVHTAPVEVRTPSAPPGWSSTRGYVPSQTALMRAAAINAARAATVSAPTYTPDQLAARTPRGTRQALTCSDAHYWEPAVKKDFAMLRAKGCFINVTDKKPHGSAPPGVEQRFKIKYRGEVPIALDDLLPKQWKARTVARGDRFKKGKHYEATAAPVVHTAALKMLVAYAVAKGLLLFQFDEYCAFYGNKMDVKGVIVRLPDGFDPWSDDFRPLHLPPLYAELATGVPGIPQGSLLQYLDFSPALIDLGFKPTDADNCLFVHTSIDMATTLHVDDGILAAPSLQHAERILGPAGLGRTRTLTYGPLESTLGIDFKVDYSPSLRRVFMSQKPFAITILERAKMLDCNPARTPATAGRAYTKADCPTTDEQKAAVDKQRYHSVAMSLNFLVGATRDDMRFVQGKMAKYCSNPGAEHVNIQKHALRFLKGTLDYGIEFVWRASDPIPLDGPLDISVWTDSSFADDIDTARTTIGGVQKVNNATFSSFSRLSARVDSCVNHSELNAFSTACVQPAPDGVMTDGASMALCRTTRSITWARGVKAALEKRDVSKMPPTPVFVDNAGVLSMLEGMTIKSANKHIYKTLAENRERVNVDKIVAVIKIDTKDNLANAMTKQEPGLHDSAAQLRQIAGPCST